MVAVSGNLQSLPPIITGPPPPVEGGRQVEAYPIHRQERHRGLDRPVVLPMEEGGQLADLVLRRQGTTTSERTGLDPDLRA